MRYSGKGYSYYPYPFRPSFLVFNSQRAHETRVLKVGDPITNCEKLTFFFGAKGVNPFDDVLDFLAMEELANVNASEKQREEEHAKPMQKRKRADVAASDLMNLSRRGREQKKRK